MRIKPIKALLPMKHNSIRLPGKNYKLLGGKPLFHYVLESLCNSKYINEIIINTDSELIAKSAKENFNVTIINRPDSIIGEEFVMNSIIEYDVSVTDCEFFLQTHSTNPFLKRETIDKAIEVFFSQDEYDSLFSVTPSNKRYYWADGKPINHDPDSLLKSQDLPPIYEDNSCIYIFSKDLFNQRKNRIGYKPLMFEIEPLEAVDIDEEFDFLIAQTIIERQ